MKKLILFSALITPYTQLAEGVVLQCYQNPMYEWPLNEHDIHTVHYKNSKPSFFQEKCLATMIYGEARGEPEVGQIAVAYTAINRAVRHSVCSVVLAPKQYSIFNNNPELVRVATSLSVEPLQKTIIDKESWKRALKVAKDVYRKRVPDPTNGATHYVAYKSLVTIPAWTYKLEKVIEIQNHTFFKENSVSYAKKD